MVKGMAADRDACACGSFGRVKFSTAMNAMNAMTQESPSSLPLNTVERMVCCRQIMLHEDDDDIHGFKLSIKTGF